MVFTFKNNLHLDDVNCQLQQQWWYVLHSAIDVFVGQKDKKILSLVVCMSVLVNSNDSNGFVSDYFSCKHVYL